MVVVLSLLVALRGFGSGIVMIRDVSLRYCKFLTLNYTNRFTAMCRVLNLKKVTQCAVLDEFGLFLVLADKVLLLFQPQRFLTPFYFQGALRLSS